jgi:exopolysaccharide production protein ExoY
MSVDLKNPDIGIQTRHRSAIKATVQIPYKKIEARMSLIKRALDIFGALVGLLILLPVSLVVFVVMKVQEPNGNILFKQDRIGLNGSKFRIYKFRSMLINAEEKLQENPELYRKYVENNYKLEQEEDPRITKIGGFLRKTSLDELPQFINVLKGEMSLVGPRPVVEEELREYGDRTDKFLSVKPGVTGYWQVNGRSDVGYPERVDLELYYVDNISIWLDVKIMVLTIWNVVSKKGAY